MISGFLKEEELISYLVEFQGSRIRMVDTYNSIGPIKIDKHGHGLPVLPSTDADLMQQPFFHTFVQGFDKWPV